MGCALASPSRSPFVVGIEPPAQFGCRGLISKYLTCTGLVALSTPLCH
jgi:hypothetical protein